MIRGELQSMLEATQVASRIPQTVKELERVSAEIQRLYGRTLPAPRYPNENLGCVTSVFVAAPVAAVLGYFLLHPLGMPVGLLLGYVASGFFTFIGFFFGDVANHLGEAAWNWTQTEGAHRLLAALTLGLLAGAVVWWISRYRIREAVRRRIEYLMKCV